jgi:hypothetical protein
MEALAFIAKFFDSTWKVGLPFAIAASIIFAFRLAHIEPFASLDQSFWGVIAVAGVVGFCLAIVEAFIWVSLIVNPKITARGERGAKRRNAINNLSAITVEQAQALLFIKRNNMQRFLGPCLNILLHQLNAADLIDIGDKNITENSTNTYYLVPDYVWNAIEDRFGRPPTPERAPWLPTPEEEWRRKHGIG